MFMTIALFRSIDHFGIAGFFSSNRSEVRLPTSTFRNRTVELLTLYKTSKVNCNPVSLGLRDDDSVIRMNDSH